MPEESRVRRKRHQRVPAIVAIAGALTLLAWWGLTATAELPLAQSGDCHDRTTLPDGRVVYARPLSAAGAAAVALYAAASDGTQEHRISFGDARDEAPALLGDGRIVFRRHQGQGPGRLFAMNPDGTGLQLFYEPPAHASIEGGPWLVDDRVVVAERDGAIGKEHLVSVSAHEPLGRRVVLSGVQRPPDCPPPRPRPLALTSVVDERKSTGTLLCLDVRTSRIATLAAARPGTIRSVRVLAADGRELGEVAVEPDGSFFIEVPADQALRLELHGPDGVLAADHSGLWVRPNENRGCIGCHEDPELAPENRVPLALAGGPVAIRANADVSSAGARVP